MKQNNTQSSPSNTSEKVYESMPITLYWWNCGRKTKDFDGTIEEYLEEKNIRVKKIKHPQVREVTGYQFKFEISNRYVSFDIYFSKYEDACIEAIQLFLTVLGDRALMITRHKTININR